MFCSNCGQKYADTDKFCSNCGTGINLSQNTLNPQRIISYVGELRKCPNCGELLDAFVVDCPACGYELRGVDIESPVQELASKLEQATSSEQKIELIRNFYIPNTKEDICEFFILAVSNMSLDDYDAEAWGAKVEQAYQKAQLSFGGTPEFQYLHELYEKARKKQKSQSFFKGVKALQKCLIVIIGVILIIVGEFAGANSQDPDSPFYMLACVGLLILTGGGIQTAGAIKRRRRKMMFE